MSFLYINKLLSSTITQELEISKNIGEIDRLDEVLTMSAKLYTASQDYRYYSRYNVNATKLDQIIESTFYIISVPEALEALEALQQTKSANKHLIQIEPQAINYCQQKQCKQGYKLLHSDEHQQQKAVYKVGMQHALQKLQSLLARAN